MSNISKLEYDNLYHILRKASASSPMEREAVRGLTQYLVGIGTYTDLEQFLSYYGTTFIAPEVVNGLLELKWKPARFVELGAGMGWLSSYLRSHLSNSSTLTIDKRNWPLIDHVLNLEEQSDINILKSLLKPDDIIVMSEFLHCITNVENLLSQLSPHRLIVVEYAPDKVSWQISWDKQITARGGKHMPRGLIENILTTSCPGYHIYTLDLSSHIISFLTPRNDKEKEG